MFAERMMSKSIKELLSTWTVVAVVVGGALSGAQDVRAQGEETAQLRGVVYDSTAMAVLDGARVAVLGTSAAGVTDAGGRFELDGVPVGSFWVAFYHPRLEELGVAPPTRQVAFGGGSVVEVQLGVPSYETLLLQRCLAVQPRPGYSALAGTVVDSITGLPMPNAHVTIESVSTDAGMPRPIEVQADEMGYFQTCSVAGSVDLVVQAHYDGTSGRSVELALRPGTARIQDLMMVMSVDGSLSGYVRDYVTEAPVSGASVAIVGTRWSTYTDAAGSFRLDGLPPGRHLLSIDHIAFEESTDMVTVLSQETVEVEVLMATEALEVQGLSVVGGSRAARDPGAPEPDDRITREEIELLLPGLTAATDLLRNVDTRGLQVRDVYAKDEITGTLVPSLCIEINRRADANACRPAAVLLNDVVVQFPDQFLRDLDPSIIDRIEILSAEDARGQFGLASGYGAVSIYTR